MKSMSPYEAMSLVLRTDRRVDQLTALLERLIIPWSISCPLGFPSWSPTFILLRRLIILMEHSWPLLPLRQQGLQSSFRE